jgi:hypothetical protein
MAALPKQLILPSPEAAAPPQQLKGLFDELWEDIFLRVASPSDLARASATCSSFRRLIADPSFLHRHRSIHPQPVLLGFIISPNLGSLRFKPIEPPNPNAPAADALAAATGFTFDYLPQPEGKPFDVRDGRILLERPTAWNDDYRFPDLMMCDPLSRRSMLLRLAPSRPRRPTTFLCQKRGRYFARPPASWARRGRRIVVQGAEHDVLFGKVCRDYILFKLRLLEYREIYYLGCSGLGRHGS